MVDNEKVEKKLLTLEKHQQIVVVIGAIVKSMNADQEIRFHKALAELVGEPTG